MSTWKWWLITAVYTWHAYFCSNNSVVWCWSCHSIVKISFPRFPKEKKSTKSHDNAFDLLRVSKGLFVWLTFILRNTHCPLRRACDLVSGPFTTVNDLSPHWRVFDQSEPAGVVLKTFLRGRDRGRIFEAKAEARQRQLDHGEARPRQGSGAEGRPRSREDEPVKGT